jgi:hypothetical protein
MARILPRIRGFGTRAPQRDILIAVGLAQTSLSAPLRALAQSLTVRWRAIRGLSQYLQKVQSFSVSPDFPIDSELNSPDAAAALR